MNKGIWYAVGAYVIWGLFPAYWRFLQDVPALQLIGHRIAWSFLLLLAALLALKRSRSFSLEAFRWTRIRSHAVAALLLGANWLIFVWAVNAGYIVEASLGYFINPLFSVFLGVIFFRERLRSWQWVPVFLAAIGVLYLTFVYGRVPWIALSLAGTFGLYGMSKKKAALGSFYGLTLETGILFLPALGYLLWVEHTGEGAFLHASMLENALMVGAGAVTVLPLLLFSMAARRIPLSLIGILQYIGPTLQFLLGVLVYHEPFSAQKLIGFGIVWLALLLFVLEGILSRRNPLLAPTS